MSQPTPWVPLNSDRREIRLLDLAPKSSDPNQLSCDLRVVSLDDKPAYEALSYVWGEKDDPPNVLCVGGHTLTITKNLFEALNSLRWDDGVRTLWVDAVCILQTNNEERSWQVSMMGDIYENSAMVLIWLGSGDLDQNPTTAIQQHASDSKKHFTDLPKILMPDHTRTSWWHRAWTLQEAVLGPSLTYCWGKERCSERQFLDYLKSVMSHLLPGSCCNSILQKSLSGSLSSEQILMDITAQACDVVAFRGSFAHRWKGGDFLRLTLDHQSRSASDPRDKLFAFVGMADRRSVPQNLVQYNLPVVQIMVNTASKLLQNTNTLEVIRHATSVFPGEKDLSDQDKDSQSSGTAQTRRLQDLPSWCPDWTQDIPTMILKSMRRYREEMHGQFRAGMSHQANVVFHGDSCLGVTGIKCDRVIHVGRRGQSYPTDFEIDSEWSKTLRQWCYMVGNSLPHHAPPCDGCGSKIYGIWFKCQSCKDFDLCCRCMQVPDELHAAEHNLLPNYFLGSEFERNGENWSGLMKKATLRNMELQRIPGFKEQSGSDGCSRLSGPLWERLLDVEYPFTDGDSLQDALRRTLLGDHPIPWKTSAGLTGTFSTLREVALLADLWSMKVEDRPIETLVGESRNYNKRDLENALNRMNNEDAETFYMRVIFTAAAKQLVVSQKGYIGLAPAGTRVGDHICVLHGGEMPFILRECSGNDSSDAVAETAEDYVLIGEAYVHGLMHGEAVTAADAGELPRVHMVLH